MNSKKDFRQAIVDAASELFVQKGFGGTHMHDIAARLGISRPALYYYFKNKEKILEALVHSFTMVAKEESTRIATRSALDPAAALKALVVSYALLVLGHSVQFRVLDRTEAFLTGRTRRLHEKAKRALLDGFTAIIQRGIAKRRFRPVDARLSALACIAMCNWTAWWFKPGGRRSQEQLADAIADLAEHAVRRPEPRQPGRADDAMEALRLLREDAGYLAQLINGR